jgi:hypothetical protein
MKITRELALQILRYLGEHPEFYFPFRVVCQDFKKDSVYYDWDCIDIKYQELENNNLLSDFMLEENLQNLDTDTTELMAKGFIDKITKENKIDKILALAKEYRGKWKIDLCKSEDIIEYGLNEFIGGKADAFEKCVEILNAKA